MSCKWQIHLLWSSLKVFLHWESSHKFTPWTQVWAQSKDVHTPLGGKRLISSFGCAGPSSFASGSSHRVSPDQVGGPGHRRHCSLARGAKWMHWAHGEPAPSPPLSRTWQRTSPVCWPVRAQVCPGSLKCERSCAAPPWLPPCAPIQWSPLRRRCHRCAGCMTSTEVGASPGHRHPTPGTWWCGGLPPPLWSSPYWSPWWGWFWQTRAALVGTTGRSSQQSQGQWPPRGETGNLAKKVYLGQSQSAGSPWQQDDLSLLVTRWWILQMLVFIGAWCSHLLQSNSGRLEEDNRWQPIQKINKLWLEIIGGKLLQIKKNTFKRFVLNQTIKWAKQGKIQMINKCHGEILGIGTSQISVLMQQPASSTSAIK